MTSLAILVLVMQVVASDRTVAGRIVDPTGLPVSGAIVRASAVSGTPIDSVSAGDGSFRVAGVPRGPVLLIVSAAGFAETTFRVGAEQTDATILLRPRGITESITVSANPANVRLNTPASATVLDYEVLSAAPAWTLDEQLRSVPGFSLFRRSSSRVANPTTQGVTLRGLAASGASRALVLADGIPLNDPFGGWVYWDRLPAASIDRVEVARGGSSDFHGTDALGGVIRIDTSMSERIRVVTDVGSDETWRISGYGGRAFSGWQLFGAAEAFTTDGFVIVGPESRGPIDVPARSEHGSVYGGAGTMFGTTRLDVRGNYFDEDRGNGTPFQTNATIVRQFSVVANGDAWSGTWMARAFGLGQGYDQSFSAVAADRVTERPTGVQHVDTESGGGSFEWVRGAARHAWLVRADYRLVDADLFEGSPIGNAPLTLTAVRQQAGGIAGQASFNPSPRWTIGAGARGEVWRSGLRELGHTQYVGVFPRASVAWRATEILSLHAAAHNAYRTPTINELFRPFRVGNATTLANPSLRPENAYGVEGSALLRRGPAATRITGFWTRLEDAVVNVTLASSPTVIVRERQNAGTIRAAGIELEADVRLTGHVAVTASAAYIDSVFTRGVALEGLRVPQVPRWQAAGGLTGTWSRATASLDWRFIDQQFDDDRNQFSLDSSTSVNARIGWRTRRVLEVFAAIENALDEEQDVGRTPLRTIGLPRTVRIGIRWSSR